MTKAYLVMELYMGCCYIESKPNCVYADKESAELYAKEMNETDKAKEFVSNFSWDDVEFKYFVKEIECKQ